MNKVFFIGNAHLDPVWLWQWQEGYAEIKATFAAALERIEDYGDRGFVFTSACAAYYQWVEENCPELFVRIQKAVREGKWVIAGGMWIQPDCNLPSGESFARHALYSQRYFWEKFGITATLGHNVDSFGHAGTLPMLLKESGLKGYVFKRPSEEENSRVPYVFSWESPDGTRLPAFKIPHDYGDAGTAASLHYHLDECLKIEEQIDLPVMCFIGVCNHGGGPTVAVVEEALKLMAKDDRYRFGSPEDYFRELEDMGALERLPVFSEELQHHASGCYATTASLKAANRKAEHRLYAAEAAMACAHQVLELPYQNVPLRQAWDCVLFNQFHDTMGGCSIEPACEDAMEQYGEALSISARLYNAAVQKITWAVNTMPPGGTKLSKDYNRRKWERENGGAPVIVWNPHGFPVECEVQTLQLARAVTDVHGNPVPWQSVRAARSGTGDRNEDTLFRVSLPPLGYSTYYVYRETQPQPGEAEYRPVTVTETEAVVRLDNGLVTLEVDKTTGVAALLDGDGRVLTDSCGIVDIRDDSQNDTWAHGVLRYDQHLGVAHCAKVQVMERGGLRSSVRVTASWKASTVTQEFFLAAECKEVECRVRMNWQEPLEVVKLGFRLPGAVACEYEMPYGSALRPCNGEEEPGHAWVDIRSEAEGLTLLNDAKYSYSAEGEMLYLTALRTTSYAHQFQWDVAEEMRDEYTRVMDLGEHCFRYVLSPHKTFDRLAASQRARLLNLEPAVIPETWHTGPLPLEHSFASGERCLITALKHAEDGKGTVVRLFNPEEKAVEAKVHLDYLGRELTVPVGKYQVVTYRITPDAEPERLNFTEL